MKSVVMLLLCVAPALADDASLPQLTVQQVNQKRAEKNVLIFDCNSEDRYKAEHLPGAKWVHYKKLDKLALGGDTNATLIFYCANEH
jgi:rhodanese-related sulfurtransferase